ncbi:MAG: SusC/RagA family TonB-linked outer membrane protein, partial [Bacteroidia bacterium]|nr:SusC/RagA family TonB-linked outer membrane protein [Bacteroidia bacterium]
MNYYYFAMKPKKLLAGYPWDSNSLFTTKLSDHLKQAKAFRLLTYLLMIMSISLPMLSQAQEVSGRLIDDSSSPLIGANVLVKGTTKGAITDGEGRYTVSASSNDSLIFSYLGYETKAVYVGDQTVINVQLQPAENSLDAVVVVGYGQTQNRKTSTNAISSIGSGRISEVPVSRPEQLLQGTVPGVVVSQNSGSPGTPLTIRLRGVSTAGGAQPLILVDGVQVPDLNFLNSNDIANISLLKDAAASAIYGARGGNGVVLVQTKKGKRFSDGPEISINGSTGFQNLLRKPDVMDRDAYVAYYNEFAETDANLNPISDEDRAKLANTDWYDEVFDDNVPVHNYNISLADGGDRYSYYLSGGLFDQRGLVGGESGKSRYQRNNVKMNFEVDVLKNLNLSVGVDLVDVNRNFLLENQAGTFSAVMNFLPALPAIYPVFDEEGNPYDMGQFGTGVVN